MSDVASLPRESPVALLELKLKAWMVQQPEWLLIVAMSRQERRAAMRELANRLYTIPIMDGSNTVPRVVRRKAARALGHAAKTGQLTEQVQAALVEAAQLAEVQAEIEEKLAEVVLEGLTPGERDAVENGPAVPPFTPMWENPDPEGDVKADLEAAERAISFIEVDDIAEEVPEEAPDAPQEAVGATESDVEAEIVEEAEVTAEASRVDDAEGDTP